MRLEPLVLICALAGAALCTQPQDPAIASRRAKELMAGGRFAEAVPIYEQILKAMPGNNGIRLNLAMALHMAGEDARAIPHFEEVLKQAPRTLPALMLLGAAYLRTGQPARASPVLERAVALAPEDLEGRAMLVDALLMTERHGAALPHLKKLAAADPRNPRAWYGLGRAYEALAQQSFGRLERLGVDTPWWLYLAAEARLKLGRNTAAYALLRAVLEKDRNFRGAHARLAEVYRKTGHEDWAAVEEGREKRQPAPDCAVPSAECRFRERRHEEALALARRGRTSEAYFWQVRAANELARSAFEHLMQLPPSVEAYQVMAELYRNQGRHGDSIKQWEAALKMAPGDPRLEEELLTSVYMSRDYSAAEGKARELLKRDPGSPELHFILGDSLMQQQRPEEALAFLDRAVRLRPDDAAARAVLGRALMQLGQAEKAVPNLEAALAGDSDGSLHVLLSRAYQATGRKERAAEMLKQYQSIRKVQSGEEVAIAPPVP